MDLDVSGKTTIKDISGSDASFNNIDIINGDANIDNNATPVWENNIASFNNILLMAMRISIKMRLLVWI